MELVNDQYFIGGLPVNELIKKYGTPVYFYDAHKIESQYHRFLKAFENTTIKVNFACKALTNINILKLVSIFMRVGCCCGALQRLICFLYTIIRYCRIHINQTNIHRDAFPRINPLFFVTF